MGHARTRPANGPGSSVLANERNGIVMPKHSLLSELWAFMRVRKKWWLLPIIIMLLLIGSLLVFAQGSALAPFIYTVF